MDTPDAPSIRLSRRLRQLRETAIPGARLTQTQVARALNVSVPSISSWESTKSPALPPVDRLNAYALLFATNQGVTDGRIRLPVGAELTDDERTRLASLEQELLALHPGRPQTKPQTDPGVRIAGLYQFGAGEDVTIVCAPLPPDLLQTIPYSDPKDPDHVELYTYADPDALIELYGHVRAANPTSQVNYRLAPELKRDDYTSHLIVLGGVDWNELTRLLLESVDVPVRQIPSEEPGGSCFEVTQDCARQTFRPSLDRDGALIEDIAHVFRGPNPYNHARTLTLCNGTFGRGTYAAVRALTDSRFRDRNEQHVRDQLAGGRTFSILARVRIVGGKALTPDWTAPETRLHEWF